MSEKNKGGRPPRYEGETPIRIGGTVRPRYKEMLEMLRRHRDTSVNEVLEFAIARASHTTVIEGKSIYEWCVSDSEIYWRIYQSIGKVWSVSEMDRLKSDIESLYDSLTSQYDELKDIFEEIYPPWLSTLSAINTVEIDAKLSHFISFHFEDLRLDESGDRFRKNIHDFLLCTLEYLSIRCDGSDNKNRSYKQPLEDLDYYIKEIEAKPLKMQHTSELYKLEYFKEVKKLNLENDENYPGILYISSIGNHLYEFWKSDIPMDKLIRITKDLFIIVGFDNFDQINQYYSKIELVDKFQKTLQELGVFWIDSLEQIERFFTYYLSECGLVSSKN